MKVAYWDIQIDIKKAIEERGHEAVAIDWHSNDWVNILAKSKCDLFIWYPHSLHGKFHLLFERSFFIENFLNKKCFPSAKSSYLFQDKLRQKNIFDLHGMPQVETKIIRDIDNLDLSDEFYKFPLVVKDPWSYGGFNISVVKNSLELKGLIDSRREKIKDNTDLKRSDYLYVQKFVKIEEEYRVMTLGQKILLSYRKKSDQFLKHVWRGADVFFDVDEGINNLVRKWNEDLKLDCCGWDLVRDEDGKIYLLELNIIFGTKILESKNINLADEIVEHCFKEKKLA